VTNFHVAKKLRNVPPFSLEVKPDDSPFVVGRDRWVRRNAQLGRLGDPSLRQSSIRG
jgi:hypothetical protein